MFIFPLFVLFKFDAVLDLGWYTLYKDYMNMHVSCHFLFSPGHGVFKHGTFIFRGGEDVSNFVLEVAVSTLCPKLPVDLNSCWFYLI